MDQTEDGAMTPRRAILIGGVLGLVLAACTGPGAGYGGALAPVATPTPAPAASQAPAPSPSIAAAGDPKSEYGNDGYGGTGRYGGGSAATPAGSTAPGTVQLSGYAFQPATLTVKAGTTVSFVNGDAAEHNIVEGQGGTATAGSSLRADVAPAATGTITFATAGTIQLTCTIHPTMSMTVTVTP
jgi:plastocyanin